MVEKSAFDMADEPSSPAVSQGLTFPDPHSLIEKEYAFSQVLAVHTGAVRSLAVQNSADMLMSGSIDFSNKMYTFNRQIGKYEFIKEVLHHEGFVMNIIPAMNGTGFYSAGKDQRVVMIDLEGNPVLEYTGHTGAVNSLSQSTPNELVTGSWDGTAKIWNAETGECTHTLEGHSHAVSVLTLPNGITITGSQDKMIRLWYNGEMSKEFLAHDDIVRGFAEVPLLNGFASISNDETVKLWSMDGTHMMDFKGHNGFIFAIDCLETGEIVTGGDDCTVKLWADGKCKQTIQLPKTVWSVTHNQHGDIIVGCEDKKIRVFTRDPARQDLQGEDFKTYEEECKTAAQGGEQIDVSKLPDFKTAIEGKVQGKSDGFVQVFREDGVAFAFMWSDAEKKWNKIGEVQNPGQAAQETGQGNAGGIGKTEQYAGDPLFKAGEYDKIIDVDLGDGVFRKLPCNNGGNYLETADKFCSREHLGRSYVEQIVTFLRQNTLPYATRDLTEGEPTDKDVMNSFFGGAAGAVKKTCTSIPNNTRVYYEVAKLEGAKKKILEFNVELGSPLESQDLIYFETMINVLQNVQSYNRSEVSPQQVKVIDKLLQFPLDKAFPVADIYRVYLLHPSSYEAFSGSDAGIVYIQGLIRFISDTNYPKNLILCSIRALNNLFKNMSSQHVACLNRQKLVDAVTPHLVHADKGVRQAAITFMMNFSVEFLSRDEVEGRIQVISALATCIPTETDLQNLLRAATALGNCAHKCPEATSLIPAIGITFPADSQIVVAGEADASSSKKIINEIKAMLLEQ